MAYKKLYYLLFIVAGITALGLVIFGFSTARASHVAQQKAFTLENISIENKTPLTANFVETGSPQEFSFPFVVTNNTKYDYRIYLTGEVLENGSELPRTEAVELPAHQDVEIKLAVPLAFPTELAEEDNNDATFNLKLQLSTEIAAKNLLGALLKDIEKEFQLEMKLAQDEDIAEVMVVPNTQTLEHSSNNAPTLYFDVIINNKVKKSHEFGIYEIQLLSENKEIVQPIMAKELELEALQEYKNTETFKFKVPPANQLNPGSQRYYLKIEYSARTGDRQFTVNSTSAEAFNFTVL